MELFYGVSLKIEAFLVELKLAPVMSSSDALLENSFISLEQ